MQATDRKRLTDLELAYAAARSKAPDIWFLLSPSEQTRAIYQELRLIDAGRVTGSVDDAGVVALST